MQKRLPAATMAGHVAAVVGRQEQRKRLAAAPQVGIFWFLQKPGEPAFFFGDGVPVAEAEAFEDLRTFPDDHMRLWNRTRRFMPVEFRQD